MSARARPIQLWRASRAMLGAFAAHAGWSGARAALLVAAAAALEGFGLLLLVPILGVVVSPASEGASGLVMRTLRAIGAATPGAQLALLVMAFVAISAIRAITLYARDIALARLQTGFIEAERNRLVQVLARTAWSRMVGLSHSRVTNLMTNEIQRLTSALHFMIQGAVLAMMLLVQAGIAFTLSPALASVAVLLVAVAAGVFLLTQGKIRDLGGEMVRAGSAMMASASGFLGGLKTAAAQNAQGRFVAEFEAIQAAVRSGQLAFQQRQARSRLTFGLGSGVVGALMVYVGFAVLHVGPAALIILVLVFVRMAAPAMLLFQSAQNFVFALPSFEAVHALEAELQGGAGDHAVAPVAPPQGPIELIGATYRYPGDRGVREASTTIAPGSFVGIAGPSGAGKTTLVDLIVGLLAPQSGEVRVGGSVLDEGGRRGWAGAIAYVAQDGFLFHDTVRRNLTWSCPAASDEAIGAALALAGASELVAGLARGLDTVVGERGTLLSGGERQRLAIARALLMQPRLLVLDEAANAIDAAGEAALLARVKALDPRPTILMISHREESLKWCDRVIRVEAGQISG